MRNRLHIFTYLHKFYTTELDSEQFLDAKLTIKGKCNLYLPLLCLEIHIKNLY